MQIKTAILLLVFCVCYGLLVVGIIGAQFRVSLWYTLFSSYPDLPFFLMFFPMVFSMLIKSFEQKEIKRKTINVLVTLAFLPIFITMIIHYIPSFFFSLGENFVEISALSFNIGLMLSCVRVALVPNNIERQLIVFFTCFSFYALFAVFIFCKFYLPVENLSAFWPIFIVSWLISPIAIIVLALYSERCQLRNNELVLNIPGFLWAFAFYEIISRMEIDMGGASGNGISLVLIESAMFFVVLFPISIFIVAAIYYYKYPKIIHDTVLGVGTIFLFIGFLQALVGDYPILIASIVTLLSLVAGDFLDKIESKIFGPK
jgi:hypothetical protein